MRRGWFVAVLALAGCTTETLERDQMGLYRSPSEIARSTSAQSEPEAEKPREEPKGRVVTIPPEAAAKSKDFSDRKSTIFSDVVEVDLSREGWLALASFSISRDAVMRRDEEDPRRGVVTITLQRLPNVAAMQDSVPTVRFGDGLRVVGVDRVVLRFWTQPSVERPVWFHAIAAGKSALYAIETEPRQEWKGRSVEVRSELHRVGDTYRFDWSAQGRP